MRPRARDTQNVHTSIASGRRRDGPPVSPLRYRIEPRDVTPTKAARRLGLTLPEFERLLERLVRRGFPEPDPDTGHFDIHAVDEWLDRRSGLTVDGRRQHAASDLKKRLENWNGGVGAGER